MTSRLAVGDDALGYQPQRAYLVAGEGAIRESARTPFSWSGSVQTHTAATVELDFAYFPGWQVRVDGNCFRWR
jgi:hypothetical protein